MSPGMKKLLVMQTEIQNAAIREADPDPGMEHTHTQDSQTLSSVQALQPREPFHVPTENTLINYGRTKRQLYLAKQNETDELFKIMNERFEELTKKEAERRRTKHEEEGG